MAPPSEKEEQYGLLSGDETARHPDEESRVPTAAPSRTRKERFYAALLSASILLNAVFLFALLYPRLATVERPSPYADLHYTHEEPYVMVTPYASDNTTLQDQLWHDINVDAAVVALSDDWAAERGLRTAQRFPWDHSKGIYILHGFHNLHCLKIVYLSLSEFRREAPQTRSWHHISHCMDALRRQILCDADDTPRATDRRVEVVSGLWQHRQCRSWDQLEAFARAHTACYKRPETPESDPAPMVERFKHCPPDSGYIVTDNYEPPEELLEGLPAESIQDEV